MYLSKLSVYDFQGEYVRLPDELALGLRKVTETEKRDISYLTEEKFLDFFINHKEECKRTSTGSFRWNYPDIMNEFQDKVIKAKGAIDDYGVLNRDQTVWAQMRDKYFNGKQLVFPDEMIEKLEAFDNKEIIAFLYYCVCYKERFFDGVYGIYAADGIIGKLLSQLSKMPKILIFD